MPILTTAFFTKAEGEYGFQTKFFEFSNLESGEMDPPAFLVHLKLPKASLATRQVKVHN